MKNVLMMLICLPVIFNTTAQPPSTAQRMIGYSRYDQTQQQIIFYDSGSLTYSGTRGSDYDFDHMDHEGWMYYFDSPMSSYNGYRFKADVWIEYENDSDITTRTFTYNSDNKVTHLYSKNNTFNVGHHTIYRYKGQDIDFAERLEYGSGSDTLNRIYFKYNGGLLVEDSSMEKLDTVWHKFCKFEYKYDMNGNLTNLKSYPEASGNIYKLYQESQATYTSNKQMETATTFRYDQSSNAKSLGEIDSFVYVPGVNFWVKHYSFYRDKVNNTWKPDYFIEKLLNTQMLPKTVTAYDWNGSAWVPETTYKYTYNSFGNPIHDSAFTYTGGVMRTMPFSIHHFYYEDYQLGVANAPVTSKIKVYPNPALDMLTVSCDNAASFKVELVNFLGQTVKKVSSSGDARFSIEDLAPGLYCLTVCDAGGNKLHRQTIVKQ